MDSSTQNRHKSLWHRIAVVEQETTMVKNGRFSVELVSADTKIAFQEHTKDGKTTYAEVEPEVEYFVRLGADVGPRVRARIYVDGMYLGYRTTVGSPEEEKSYYFGLWSSDGISSAHQALKFVRAKIFNSADDTETLPFWTGTIEVIFHELFDTGEQTQTISTCQNTWDGGDVGFVMGHTDPKNKGVMSTQGNFEETVKANAVKKICTEGPVLAIIKLHYCSTVGLIFAGIFGQVNPMLLARKTNVYKRGAAQVAADAVTMPPPKKIRSVLEIDGRPFGLPSEYELFDLTHHNEEKDD
jgi:hypothetical protein